MVAKVLENFRVVRDASLHELAGALAHVHDRSSTRKLGQAPRRTKSHPMLELFHR